MESWQKALALTAGAVGVGGVLCYLLSGDDEAEPEGEPTQRGALGKAGAGGLTNKEDFISLLTEIVETKTVSANKLKEVSKKLAQEYDGSKPMDFDDIYKRVKEGDSDVSVDPLEKRGIAPEAIDEGIKQWGDSDPRIQELIYKIMAPEESTKGKDVELNVLVELHAFMAKEVEAFIGVYKALPDKAKYDSKLVMMAFQVSLDTKVIQKFGIESQDVQQSIMAKQQELQNRPEFITAFTEFQKHMQTFMTMLPGLQGAM